MNLATNKKGTEMLLENIIFIVLNLIFITILVLFLILRTSDAAVLEEVYAKQIALTIDSAKPGMIIHLNMEKPIEKAKKELGKDKINETVRINDNIVTVKLREKGGYKYSFFNNVDVTPYPDRDKNNAYTGEYVFVINSYKENE